LAKRTKSRLRKLGSRFEIRFDQLHARLQSLDERLAAQPDAGECAATAHDLTAERARETSNNNALAELVRALVGIRLPDAERSSGSDSERMEMETLSRLKELETRVTETDTRIAKQWEFERRLDILERLVERLSYERVRTIAPFASDPPLREVAMSDPSARIEKLEDMVESLADRAGRVEEFGHRLELIELRAKATEKGLSELAEVFESLHLIADRLDSHHEELAQLNNRLAWTERSEAERPCTECGTAEVIDHPHALGRTVDTGSSSDRFSTAS
jgi:uncharacterized coiled-coil protein SlyX